MSGFLLKGGLMSSMEECMEIRVAAGRRDAHPIK